MTVFPRYIPVFTILLIALAVFSASISAAHERSEKMKNEDKYVPSVDALVPFESAIASFQRKLPADEEIAFVVTIVSPSESYATMIQRELESKSEYGMTVTVTSLRNSQTREMESWRIHGVSKPIRLGDLSEEKHHAVAGWAFEVAAYFQSTLQNFAYRL